MTVITFPTIFQSWWVSKSVSPNPPMPLSFRKPCQLWNGKDSRNYKSHYTKTAFSAASRIYVITSGLLFFSLQKSVMPVENSGWIWKSHETDQRRGQVLAETQTRRPENVVDGWVELHSSKKYWYSSSLDRWGKTEIWLYQYREIKSEGSIQESNTRCSKVA